MRTLDFHVDWPYIIYMTKNIDTAAIESLRAFAFMQAAWARASNRGDEHAQFTAFGSMCAAALRGEAWAIERLGHTVYVWKSFPASEDRLHAILATDTSRP